MADETRTNGVTQSETCVEKPIDAETNGPSKDLQKPKKKRSRSRTPQQSRSEDVKNLHVVIKKKAEEKSDTVISEEKEETVKDDDSSRSTRSKTNKEKEDGPKVEEVECSKEESGKKDASPKSVSKEVTPKKDSKKESSTPKKETVPKKDATPKKDSTPKRDATSQKESTPSSKKETTSSPKKDTTTKKDQTPKKTGDKSNETNGVESDSVEMDPLLIPDEIEPELLFEENSDMESGKGSPIISRCITRRSLTRNIPTPKTPKSIETDIDSEKASTISEANEEELMDSTNVSMKAEAGSDITRLDYADESVTGHDHDYLELSRERSLSETLRSLSARKPIRGSDDIRMRVLRTAQERSDLNSFGDRLGSGMKRKGRSTTPDGVKKFKPESEETGAGYSLFSSSMATLKSRFSSRSEVNSSTPKLLGYKDNTNDLHCEGDYENVHGDDEKKSWCSLM